MDLPSGYPLGALVVSAIVVVLFAIHLAIMSAEYREYHDDRAARSLLIALTLLVGAVGTLLSAIGFFVEESTTFPLVGLGMLRGALFVGGTTLLLMDRRVGHRAAARTSGGG